MERLNNWMQYSFDHGEIYGPKTGKDSVFKLHFAQGLEVKELSYYDALFYNARMMAENYSQPFDVLLSGGIDSEIVVRVFKQLGIRQNVYTFRLEDDINIRDVENAKRICVNIGVDLKIIDWNLKQWIENDAEAMYQKTFSPIVERMIRFAWFDYFDNVIVMGEGEPYWRRELEGDFSKKSNWHLKWTEDYFMSSTYAKQTGRTVIGEWYNYTPEIVKSFHKLPVIQKLINDDIPGKISCWSSRTEIHKELWPDIFNRLKLAGYEGADGYPFSLPKFLSKFQDEVIGNTSNQSYSFSVNDIDNLLK
jgi:hypothetical protein